jgi:PleD family two-component response regulator
MKLGEILVQQRILTPVLVKRILQIAASTHRRFGQALEDMGLLTGEELAQALACQYGYKIVSGLAGMTVPTDVVNLVPIDEAVENRVFPIQVKEGRIALAMADPTADEVKESIERRSGLVVVPFIATTKEIMMALARHHLGISLEQMKNSIMVVDTDRNDRTTMVTQLRNAGYHAIEAVDPEDGFRQALLQLPALIITAKDMPFSDGFAFFTTLQGVSETRRIPVILLSLRPSPEEEAMAFKRGFFDYIPMPVREITLCTRVDRALAAGRSYTPHRREISLTDI